MTGDESDDVLRPVPGRERRSVQLQDIAKGGAVDCLLLSARPLVGNRVDTPPDHRPEFGRSFDRTGERGVGHRTETGFVGVTGEMKSIDPTAIALLPDVQNETGHLLDVMPSGPSGEDSLDVRFQCSTLFLLETITATIARKGGSVQPNSNRREATKRKIAV